jgi:hypothetical protein
MVLHRFPIKNVTPLPLFTTSNLPYLRPALQGRKFKINSGLIVNILLVKLLSEAEKQS